MSPPMRLTRLKASGLININIGLLGRSRFELALNGTCPRWALIELGRFGIPLFVLFFQKMTKSWYGCKCLTNTDRPEWTSTDTGTFTFLSEGFQWPH
jgi:hypothetical protein